MNKRTRNQILDLVSETVARELDDLRSKTLEPGTPVEEWHKAARDRHRLVSGVCRRIQSKLAAKLNAMIK